MAGVVFPYYDLATALGSDQPVYGLQAAGLVPGEQPITCIETMAAQYSEALRIVQLHGPYLIGGWSFAAHVAYEMAQQLHHAGEEVALLALLDAPPATAVRLLDSLHFTATDLLPAMWPYVSEYVQLFAGRPPTADNSRNGQHGQHGSGLFKGMSINSRQKAWLSIWRNFPDAMRVLRVAQASMQALFNYTPRPYPGPLTLFRTAYAHGESRNWPALGWQALA